MSQIELGLPGVIHKTSAMGPTRISSFIRDFWAVRHFHVTGLRQPPPFVLKRMVELLRGLTCM